MPRRNLYCMGHNLGGQQVCSNAACTGPRGFIPKAIYSGQPCINFLLY